MLILYGGWMNFLIVGTSLHDQRTNEDVLHINDHGYHIRLPPGIPPLQNTAFEASHNWES